MKIKTRKGQYKYRVYRLIALVSLSIIIITSLTVYLLYTISFEMQKSRLMEIVKNEASIIETMAGEKIRLSGGARQGKTDFGRTGYGGPCPPGGTHSYYFKLYALDTTFDIQKDVSKEVLLDAMKGHILAQGQLTGKYSRK